MKDNMQKNNNVTDEKMDYVSEEALKYNEKSQGEYTVEDYRALPDDVRYELIDGYLIKMDAPAFLHQQIAGEIYRQIANFIIENKGKCYPLIAPIDIQLDCDNKTMVQPDVGILCHDDRVRKWGVYGCPDFVLEVISLSTRKRDYTQKLYKYMNAGVREYWIVDPYKKKLIMYYFEEDCFPLICGLDKPVSVRIYDGRLKIQFDNILEWIENEMQE